MADVNNNDSSIQDTQPIDSLPSSPSHSGEDKDGWLGKFNDDLAFMQDTELFEDDTWIDDEYMETQIMDIQGHHTDDFLLCGETQAVDLVFETQEEPVVETNQELEAYDGLDTQVLDHCDDEVVADSDDDVTDVLEDNTKVFDTGDSHSNGGNFFLAEDNTQLVDEKIESTCALDDLEDNSKLSDGGDSHKNAGNLLLTGDNTQLAGEKVESTCALDAQADDHGISGKVARFASVRSAAFRASALAARLATQRHPIGDCSTLVKSCISGQGETLNSSLEYNVGEIGNQQCSPSISVKKTDDLRTGSRTARKLFLEDSPEENGLSVNLSYIDSQEPGEASQASALNLVDKLITESGLDLALDVEADFQRSTEEKTKVVPSVKGPQELAKKASNKSGTLRDGIFEWDDNREDEGGGDIYRRRKEEFFGIASKARESATLRREQKSELIHENHRGLAVAVNKRRALSDSRLLQGRVTRSRKKIQTAKKNLGKELEKVSEDRSNKVSDMRKVVDLGNDTQMASEAIGALCSGGRGKFDAEVSCHTGKKPSPSEDRGFANGGVITRQSKGTKRIQAMGDDELLKRRMKKASPVPTKACGKNIDRSSKGNQLDKEGPCCWKRKKVQTTPRKTRKRLVDELDELSKESNTRMFDRLEEAEAGPDTQMAVEAINALRSGDGRDIDNEPNCLIGEKLSPEAGISSHGVITRKSKRIKGIQAVDSDVELLKQKTKKARSVLVEASDKNMEKDKPDMADEVVLSNTEKRPKKHCTSKQPWRGEADVLGYPKRRRSARISQDQVNGAERSLNPAFDTPVKSATKTASKIVSPICMGDEYHRLSCKDSFTSHTTREFLSLTSESEEPVILETKSTRNRRDFGSVRVLFSQHLDEDATKHQKKIMARFDISEASSMIEATHFIADSFTRTRNMLEAIASGKPVVTTQWLESIDQVNIYVDEGPYILRDLKKEKEFGFNMGVSLARARQYPLLQGRKVFITPNTNPGLNTITTLVKAVHGLPVERLGRSALSEDKIPENLLVLSCEKDRDISKPFLERGGEVYSSELLLNGIVTQKLEYERYRLFTDHVRRTRSTIWIRDGKGDFHRR